jgi:hypothetical protein
MAQPEPTGRTGSQSTGVGGIPIKEGLVFGVISYLVGYVITYVLFQVDSDLEAGQTLGETSSGGFEAVGWLFYNSHFVDVKIVAGAAGASGSQTRSILSEGATSIPSLVYYLVPIAALLLGGSLLGQRIQATSTEDALIAGATLVAGYLPLTVLGTFLFEASAEQEILGQTASYSVSPDFVPALLIMGIAFPVILGAVGSYRVLRSSSGREGR